MLHPNKTTFLVIWPRCFITFLGVIEFMCFVMFILTELCSVSANFWLTNVFAGGWCGFIVLFHTISVFIAGICAPGPSAAFRASIVTLVMFMGCGALISFDIAFIVQPSTCVLTTSCSSNAYSTQSFNYDYRKTFYQVFLSWDAFKSYSEGTIKLLCESIQLGLATICIVCGIVYLVIYFECLRRLKKHQQTGTLSSSNPQENNSFLAKSVTPLPNRQRSELSPPPPVSPTQVYPDTLQQPANQPVYMLSQAPQPVYVAPPPSAYYPPPASAPMPTIQSIYYGPPPPVSVPVAPLPPPPPPPPPAWRAPPPFSSRGRGAVRPWYAHQNY